MKPFPRLPELKVAAMDPDTFRTCKPADLLAKNPNGKVSFIKDLILKKG